MLFLTIVKTKKLKIDTNTVELKKKDVTVIT